MSAIILQDEIVHYEVLGRGRPLIFLHGWVGSWRYWIPAMQAASISFRTYALDFWGFGDTAKTASHYRVEQQVLLLDHFLKELGIAKVALVGHGLGAVVAMLYASRFGASVDRAMVVSLPNGSDLHSRLYNATPAELVDWLMDGRSPVSEAVRLEAPKADQKAIQLSLAGIQELELSRLLLNLSTPCLMIYGQNDPVITAPAADYSTRLPNSIHQVIFDSSGHFPMVDEPARFNRLLADFLAIESGTSPRKLQLKEEWKRRVR